MAETKPAILFVCLGNICRSPMAEGLARLRFEEAGIEADIESAGIGNWHQGDPPDRRAINAAWKFLVDISANRARQIQSADFDRFDYIIAMDDDNIAALEGLADQQNMSKICLLLDFSDLAERQITDPYYGGHSGFDQVL
ncbi:MAG: low molecular weight protein-tyrosine-phosphatase, partial [Hyphomicrobiales bacterium]